MADLQQTVGAVLRRERRERRLTMRDVAQRAALSVVYLGEIERGKKYPSALVLERLTEALDMNVPDLLERLAAQLRTEASPAATRAIGHPLPRQEPLASQVVDRQPVNLFAPRLAA